jgi:hypothetical protein
LAVVAVVLAVVAVVLAVVAVVLAVVGTELPLFVGVDVVMPFSRAGTCEQTEAG